MIALSVVVVPELCGFGTPLPLTTGRGGLRFWTTEEEHGVTARSDLLTELGLENGRPDGILPRTLTHIHTYVYPVPRHRRALFL